MFTGRYLWRFLKRCVSGKYNENTKAKILYINKFFLIAARLYSSKGLDSGVKAKGAF